MKRFLPLLSVAFILLVAISATSVYRQARPGERLYNLYFEAASPVGYATSRALSAGEMTGDAAILEQAKRYHEAGDYDFALSSLRAYLESNPVPKDYLPELLAGTAAMATGNYGEARRYFQQLPEGNSDADAAALFYLSLLDLKEENLNAAKGKLTLLAEMPGAGRYPVGEMLGRIGE